MILGSLFRKNKKPNKEKEPQDIDVVLEDVRNYAANLRRNSSEINQWLTSLKGHNHG